MDAATGDITALLRAWTAGDGTALDRLMPVVHDQLRRLARHYMRHERPDHTLQATALVNEAYLRLVQATDVSWQDRAHFFAMAAQAMRRILIDAARARQTDRRGGEVVRVELDESQHGLPERGNDLLALDAALEALEQFDARKARIVEMKFFAGLSVEETATILKISPRTAMRDWHLARAWLARELSR